jgi:signal transduction histidine kinase
VTAVDTALADVARRSGAMFFLVLDAQDRVVESNAFTRGALGLDPVGRPFAALLASVSQDIHPRPLATASLEDVRVNFMVFTRLPHTFLCSFRACGEDTLVVGGPLLAEELRLSADLMRISQELATERRALQKSNAQLEQLGALKDRFLGMAAHDLRSPLAAVMNTVSLLQEELHASLNDTHRQDLQGMLDACTQMRHLVNAFLSTAIIQSGELRPRFATATLEGPVTRGLRLAAPLARQRKVHLRVVHGERLPALWVDEQMMEQVVTNLVSNALQHSAPGKEVLVRTALVTGCVVLDVVDQGEGIPPAIQRDLFSAFMPTGRRTGPGERSIGLGLAICRLIVEAHRGVVVVSTIENEGSTFTVRLPVGFPEPVLPA